MPPVAVIISLSLKRIAFGAQPHGLGGVAFAGSGAFTRIRRAQAGAFKDEGSEGLRVPNSGRKSDATAKGVPDYGRLAAFSAALAIRDGADECEQGFGLRMERVGLRTIGAVAAPVADEVERVDGAITSEPPR